MGQGLTTEQSAAVVGGLLRAATRQFEIIGQWATNVDHHAVAVSLATSSRHLGWHLDDLEDLLGDSQLLAGGRHAVPAGPGTEVAFDAIAAIEGPIERLAVTHRVLLAQLELGCVVLARRTSEHADAPLRRVIGFLAADLRRDRVEGELLLAELLADTETVARVGEQVTSAERLLVVAGGLLVSLGIAAAGSE